MLTERTAKRLKWQVAVSGLMLVAGVLVLVFMGDPRAVFSGVLLTGCGFVWHVVTRIRIWWHHGWPGD